MKSQSHKTSPCPPRILVALFFTGMLGFLGCQETLPEGKGSLREVVVLADSTDWSACGDAVEEVFGQTVETPEREPVFALRRGDAAEFGFFRSWQNVFLLASLEDGGQTALLVRSLLSSEVVERIAQGEAHVFFKRDVWARDQVVGIVAARDRLALRRKLVEAQHEIFDTMEAQLNRRMAQRLYAEGEQTELSQELFDEFGWTLRIPAGYAVEKSLPEEGFLWLRKRVPDRWVFVWWGAAPEGGKLSGDWFRKKRDEIGRRHYEGDVVSQILSVEETSVAELPAIRVRGLWENREKSVGGPFVSHCFLDRDSGRAYIVDGAVYAPGIRKASYLRQVDLITRTFSTKNPETKGR
ncbi:MAG: DUF4837 family protein [Candidatus Latescibacterota bacterium]